MYKLLALDIDGTLLNSDGQVCPSTLKIIETIKKDILVTISTGRPIQGVYKYIELLGLEAPIITYNGGMIIDSVTKEVLYSQELSKADAKQVLELGDQHDTTMIMWSANKLYSNRIDDFVRDYQKLAGLEPIQVSDYSQILEDGITKVLWLNRPEVLIEFQEKINGKVNDSINYCTSKAHLLEFFDGNVSKAKALEFIGKAYDIKQSEMIAIGDGNNDIDMIDYVGMGVAMDNATDLVKGVSNYITTSNDQEGISNAIKHLIF